MSQSSAFIQFLKDSEQQAYRLRCKYRNRKKIRIILKKHPELNQTLKPETTKRIQSLFGKQEPLDWHMAYSALNGLEDHRYLPEDVFYNLVETSLNCEDLQRAYGDKNGYHRLFTGLRSPETILRNKWGRYYDASDRPISQDEAITQLENFSGELLIKPSIDSGGGKNVRFLEKDMNPKALLTDYDRDFLIQKKLEQVEELAQIHASSLNTLRIMTYRDENSASVLSTVVRFGRGTSRLDNQAAGGLSCGIRKGRLQHFAVDKYGGRYEDHPDSGLKFDNRRIPGAEAAETMALHLHEQLDYFKLVSWDIALDKNALPNLIEMNLRYQEINFHQFNNGPIFKDLIDKQIIPLR